MQKVTLLQNHKQIQYIIRWQKEMPGIINNANYYNAKQQIFKHPE